MKKLFYSIVVVAICTTASYAQKPAKQNLSAEERAEKATAILQEKLGLSNDQKLKIRQIELDRIAKMDEFRKQDEMAMKQKMEERKTFAKSTNEKIKAVLTAEQKKKLDSIKGKMKGEMKMRTPRIHRHGKNIPPSPPSNN